MIIAIGGATATGKTALGVRLAQELDGEVISVDSMQIYKGMDIGTAKATEEEKQGIPHHLIDVVDPKESFSAADFSTLAEKTISDIESRGKTPIMVGGTGLYFSSVLYRFGHGDYEEKLREELNVQAERFGAEYMWRELQKKDEKAAEKIHPNNVKRVLRALEVVILTGKSITEQNDKEKDMRAHLLYAVEMDRGMLYQKIDARVEKMFSDGLTDEVFGLIKNGVDFSMQSMQAIGYKEFKPYFDGENDIDSVKETIKQHSRNYAKRQITWFKRMETCKWLENTDIYEKTQKIVLDYNIICNKVE